VAVNDGAEWSSRASAAAADRAVQVAGKDIEKYRLHARARLPAAG